MLEIIDPVSDQRWATLVDGPDGSLFTSPLWLAALRDTYGFEFRAALISDRDTPRSGLAWVAVHDLRGRRVVGLPFCDYADPIVGDPHDWAAMARALLAPGAPVRVRSRRDEPYDTDDRFSVVNRTRWHAIDLRRDEDAMWVSIAESARRAIRKATKARVTVRAAADLDDVRAFYAMHCSVRRTKYHMLTQPFELLENLWRWFTPSSRFHLLLAEVGGDVVGGTLYLEWGDTLYYKLNASMGDGLAVRPNDLLVWHGMLLGRQRDLATFDFGQSDLDQEGLLRYKEKYATDHGTITSYAHVPPTYLDPAASTGGSVLGELTALFVDPGVPDDVYRRAGALLYRNFC